MDLQLRDECRNLLSKLKISQKSIKETLQASQQLNPQSEGHKDRSGEFSYSNFGKDITGEVNVSKDASTDLKPTYARSKLLSLCKPSGERNELFNVNSNNGKDNKENQHKSLAGGVHDFSPIESDTIDGVSNGTCTSSASSSTLRKRQLIDKHTAVDSKLSFDELRELNDERLLNFNYSNINADRSCVIKTVRNEDSHEQKDELIVTPSQPTLLNGESQAFQQQLEDKGNDRHFSHWVKKTAMEPKTLLNSSHYYSLSKKRGNSRVRFNSSCHDENAVADQRLLGYDWIAALLDNEQNHINQSESFFDEICDFRKAFKDECNNKFYMESPYTLVDREPEPVVEALTEPKVRPFVVNERLFTEPLTSDLIDNSHDQGIKKSSKEPTKDNPRFVRVSIPRSSLQTPYRVKPHRRGSFDGSDSCSLMDHCLLGWENTVPSMMPPAKSLSLACDAGTQINSQTTTLAEAERLATLNNQVQWHLSSRPTGVEVLPRWKKHYMDTTLNLTLPTHCVQNNSSNTSALNQSSVAGGRENVKRKTDRLLQATYSTMYEMERLRKERELEKEKQ